MAPEKAPAYQWYPKDAETDEAFKLMTYEQQGIYRALLDHQWLQGSIPGDPEQIARLLPKVQRLRFLRLWPGISSCFELVDGRLLNSRLERQRTDRASFLDAQASNGQKGAAKRWGRHSKPNGVAIVSPMAENSSSSATASATASSSPISVLRSPERTNTNTARVREVVSLLPDKESRDVGERAAWFIDRYSALYPEHRNGARFLPKPALDWVAACDLCAVWPSDRLEKLAIIFLKTDHEFASNGSRTIRQFAALASWCDDRLRQVETERAR